MTRVCSKCKKRKSVNAFSKKKSRKDGLQIWCKPCKRKYDSKFYLANPNATRLRNDKSRLRNRLFLRDYLLTHPCVDCGETDIRVLDFDHVRGVKRREVSLLAYSGVSISTLISEIEKCEIRCANDHRRRTAERLGVHSTGRMVDSESTHRGSNP